MDAIFFLALKYIFIMSTLLVFWINKTIYSVFLLVITFLIGAAISIFFGAYFIGLLLVVVYVGAVAVLFLFVVMMINIKDENVSFYHWQNSFLVFGFFVYAAYCFDFNDFTKVLETDSLLFSYYFIFDTNMAVIGYYLYTFYAIPFIVVSLILFVAMVGAILLAQEQGNTSKLKEKVNT
jgi:NADH-quinone oxidoreductase subunit J